MAETHGSSTETVATTEAHGGTELHAEPTLLGLGAEGWVYVGLTIFLLIAVFVARAPQKIAAVLDARIADAKRNLDEAREIRNEAEALLTRAKAQIASGISDAAAILAQAEAEAKTLLADAEAHAAELAVRRAKMAEDKIGAAERAAVAEVRARAASLAATVAGAVIKQSHDARADATLVDLAIARLN